MPKPLPDYHYRESEEDFLKRILWKPREYTDEQELLDREEDMDKKERKRC